LAFGIIPESRSRSLGIPTFDQGLRFEKTWLVCSACNARLNDPEFKSRMRSAFEAYQPAPRRVLQAHQGRQSSLVEPQSA
jgi:hypothetical protein